MAVRWVRRFSRRERRDVDLEPAQIRRHRVNERTKHTGVGRPYAPGVGGKDGGSERRARRRVLACRSCWRLQPVAEERASAWLDRAGLLWRVTGHAHTDVIRADADGEN